MLKPRFCFRTFLVPTFYSAQFNESYAKKTVYFSSFRGFYIFHSPTTTPDATGRISSISLLDMAESAPEAELSRSSQPSLGFVRISESSC